MNKNIIIKEDLKIKNAYVVINNCDGEVVTVFTDKIKALQCAFGIMLDVAKSSNWSDEESSEYIDDFLHDNCGSDIVSIIETSLEE